jgi:hypothetical protein
VNQEPRQGFDALTVRLIPGSEGESVRVCDRLAAELPSFGVEVTTAPRASPAAAVNHYLGAQRPDAPAQGLSTAVMPAGSACEDCAAALELARSFDGVVCLTGADAAVLAREGGDPVRVCWATPGHDAATESRRIVIGLTTRLRRDGAKRENVLLEAIGPLTLEDFRFRIIGQGWEPVIPRLEALGAQVDYFGGTQDVDADYNVNLEWVPTFDYYMYLGCDEGSMGFYDALAAGVGTIVTPQGYHLDAGIGIDHEFFTARELRAILFSLGEERRRRIACVRHLTWAAFAERHAAFWRGLLRAGGAGGARGGA